MVSCNNIKVPWIMLASLVTSTWKKHSFKLLILFFHIFGILLDYILWKFTFSNIMVKYFIIVALNLRHVIPCVCLSNTMYSCRGFSVLITAGGEILAFSTISMFKFSSNASSFLTCISTLLAYLISLTFLLPFSWRICQWSLSYSFTCTHKLAMILEVALFSSSLNI